MKKHLVIGLMLISGVATAQTITLNPTVTPALFNYNDQITVTYDVTNKAPLNNLTNAWIWVWIPGKNLDAKYNVNPATAAADPAKFTKSNNSGIITWSITFKPSDFFNADISNETQLGMLLKAIDWPGGQTSDYLANFGFKISLKAPTAKPVFVQPSEVITIQAEAPVSANFKLYVNEVLTDTQNSILNYSYQHTIVASPGYGTIRISATRTTGGDPSEVSFQYVIEANSPVEVRPTGIIDGINYNNLDPTKVILCLWAPGKTSVYALGDFNNWDVLPSHIMKKDGEHFWIELSGLTSGQEYGYQYLVDETIRMADPYSDKILDPDDQYIPTASYPSLKPYPAKALSPPAEWYKNRVSILQTNQTPYAWQKLDFIKPNKEGLVIYELLLRDFFGSGQRNYQTLIDTLSYFKRLGINAIQLMPIMEFNGNEGWGYNPTFMFAPDKYYGTKNKLKEFIDQCHQNGIAVILDIAMNHQDIPNSYAMMDFDFPNFRPTPSNKWFNVSATHPFSVFNDMNHESAYTKKYLDTVNCYWIREYKVDGFRFDLSKGFTQTNNPGNVSAWSAYDLSRIMILKRMADKIWTQSPDAYIILEHFADNVEEKELAEYRAGEGKGMMLWGKMTDPYNQNTMGYSANSDISWIYYGTRGWTVPHVIGYMESHDEERLMVKNIQFGNTSTTYSAKDLHTGLARMKAANLFFYTLPGPKMLWQFGELGYDQSINLCPDGSISSNCRLSPKPVKWSYLDEPGRHDLFVQTADVIRLRNSYSLFTNGEAVLLGGNSLVKQISLKNKPFVSLPVNADQMNAHVVANFDIVTSPTTVNFSHPGTWYNYYSGVSVEAANGSLAMSLEPGQYYLFTDYPVENQIITAVPGEDQEQLFVYPNPVSSDLFIHLTQKADEYFQVKIKNMLGQEVLFKELNEGPCSVEVEGLQPGLFIVEIYQGGKITKTRFVKK